MSDIHTLVIKHDRHPLDHEPPDVDYSLECPGVTDACRMWIGCEVTDCPGNTGNDDVLYDVNHVAHGQPHKYIDDGWMVPTDTCYLIAADELCDAAEYLATKEGLGEGRYQVGHDFSEGRIDTLDLVGDAR